MSHYGKMPKAKRLIELLYLNRQGGLIEDQTTELKRFYENILIRVVAQSRVITVTPNTSGDENLNAYFNPYALLCDETDQCLEGEHLCFTNFILLKIFLLQYLSRA
jgi:hypothetical protein